MKKIIVAFLGALGVSSAGVAQQAPKVVNVPVNSILFSMPTIATDKIEFEVPTASSFKGAPQFHEDNWRQLEFFPKGRLAEVQKLLKELKSFEAENRTQSGWKQIYKRQLTRAALDVSPNDIGRELNARTRPAPILTTASRPLGQVKDGFSVELGKNAYLYGLQQGGKITVLGASLQGADDNLLANAFSKLHKGFGLMLVDWRQQFILVRVDDSGEFEMWTP